MSIDGTSRTRVYRIAPIAKAVAENEAPNTTTVDLQAHGAVYRPLGRANFGLFEVVDKLEHRTMRDLETDAQDPSNQLVDSIAIALRAIGVENTGVCLPDYVIS